MQKACEPKNGSAIQKLKYSILKYSKLTSTAYHKIERSARSGTLNEISTQKCNNNIALLFVVLQLMKSSDASPKTSALAHIS